LRTLIRNENCGPCHGAHTVRPTPHPITTKPRVRKWQHSVNSILRSSLTVSLSLPADTEPSKLWLFTPYFFFGSSHRELTLLGWFPSWPHSSRLQYKQHKQQGRARMSTSSSRAPQAVAVDCKKPLRQATLSFAGASSSNVTVLSASVCDSGGGGSGGGDGSYSGSSCDSPTLTSGPSITELTSLKQTATKSKSSKRKRRTGSSAATSTLVRPSRSSANRSSKRQFAANSSGEGDAIAQAVQHESVRDPVWETRGDKPKQIIVENFKVQTKTPTHSYTCTCFQLGAAVIVTIAHHCHAPKHTHVGVRAIPDCTSYVLACTRDCSLAALLHRAGKAIKVCPQVAAVRTNWRLGNASP
jgi:hypothetical protein